MRLPLARRLARGFAAAALLFGSPAAPALAQPACGDPAVFAPALDSTSGRWGFRRPGGPWALPPRFESVPWHCGSGLEGRLYAEVAVGGRRGLVAYDTAGARLVVPVAYDFVGNRSEAGWRLVGADGLVWVRRHGREGFLDGRTWAVALPPVYDDYGGGGPYLTVQRDGRWAFLRRTGPPKWFAPATGFDFDAVGFFYVDGEGPAALAGARVPAKRDGAWGLLDGHLRPLTPFVYDSLRYHYQLYLARTAAGWGLLDRDGRPLLTPAFDEVEVMGPRGVPPGWRPEGSLRWARVRRGGRWAVADIWAGRVGPFVAEAIWPFEGETGPAHRHFLGVAAGRRGVLAADGTWAVPPLFWSVSAYDPETGQAQVRDTTGAPLYRVDREGRRVGRE